MSLIGLAACSPASERSEADSAGSSGPRPSPRAPKPAPPDPLGSLADVPPALRPAFSREAHEAPPPGLPIDGEPAQSFADFLRERPPHTSARRPSLALLPIGEYPQGFIVGLGGMRLVRSPELPRLARFLEAWFGLPTQILPAMPDEVLESLPTRVHEGQRQLDASAVLDWLGGQRPPGSLLLALTLEDLYDAGSEWLFGYASLGARVGVHSMLRYDPGFADTDARGPDFRARIRARALRVVAHEVAHMLGLRHCAHFRCIMNPTAGLEDLDALPLRLCPVCLRKLWVATGVPLAQRWTALIALCEGADSERLLNRDLECEWYAKRLQLLGALD